MTQKTKENPPSGGCPRGERAEPEPKKRIAAFHNKTLERRAKRELGDDYLYHGGEMARRCDAFLDGSQPSTTNRVRPQPTKRWVRYQQPDTPAPTRTFEHKEPLERVANDARAVIDRLKASGMLTFGGETAP